MSKHHADWTEWIHIENRANIHGIWYAYKKWNMKKKNECVSEMRKYRTKYCICVDSTVLPNSLISRNSRASHRFWPLCYYSAIVHIICTKTLVWNLQTQIQYFVRYFLLFRHILTFLHFRFLSTSNQLIWQSYKWFLKESDTIQKSHVY